MPLSDSPVSPSPDDHVPVRYGLLKGLLLMVGTLLTNFKASSSSNAEKDAQIVDLKARLASEDTTIADLQDHLALAAQNTDTPLPDDTNAKLIDVFNQLQDLVNPPAPTTPPGAPPAPTSADASTRTDSIIGAGVTTIPPLSASDVDGGVSTTGVVGGATAVPAIPVSQPVTPTQHTGADDAPGGAPLSNNLPPADSPGGSVSQP